MIPLCRIRGVNPLPVNSFGSYVDGKTLTGKQFHIQEVQRMKSGKCGWSSVNGNLNRIGLVLIRITCVIVGIERRKHDGLDFFSGKRLQ